MNRAATLAVVFALVFLGYVAISIMQGLTYHPPEPAVEPVIEPEKPEAPEPPDEPIIEKPVEPAVVVTPGVKPEEIAPPTPPATYRVVPQRKRRGIFGWRR